MKGWQAAILEDREEVFNHDTVPVPRLCLVLEGFTPQSAKPPNRSPCSNSTDTKCDNIFLRTELWILYVSKRLIRNLLSKFAWLVNCRALQIFVAYAPR